jgi:hypothetical protein
VDAHRNKLVIKTTFCCMKIFLPHGLPALAGEIPGFAPQSPSLRLYAEAFDVSVYKVWRRVR